MDDDIQYFYESRLQGEIGPDPGDPLPPTADTHRHPAEPRQLRGTVRVVF